MVPWLFCNNTSEIVNVKKKGEEWDSKYTCPRIPITDGVDLNPNSNG